MSLSSIPNEKMARLPRILLVRHGDRFDYANPWWADRARECGALVTDPPLSALGHRQARETALQLRQRLEGQRARVLSSPYLRVIQTAAPTAEALGVPIGIEPGLSEAHATPDGSLPSARERFALFPRIDPSYQPLMAAVEPTPGISCRRTGLPCEAFAGHYLVRMKAVAELLSEEAGQGETIVCFSHAASVAVVAALLGRSLRGLEFAPCGIYELVRPTEDGPWELVGRGNTNEPHVSENSATTWPWGYGEKHFREEAGGHYYGESEGIGLDYFVAKEDDHEK